MENERYSIIEDILKVPKECIENSVIPKTVIADESNLKTSDKNIFKDYVRQIKWCYNFSERNVTIRKKEEDTLYSEVQLFNVILKDENFNRVPGADKYSKSYFVEDKKIDRIIDILFRSVPYPVIIVVQYKKEIKLFVAHINQHLVDSSKITLEEIFNTNWINTENMDDLEIKLFNDIQYEKQDLNNFYSFYKGYVDTIITYNAVLTAGHDVKLNPEKIRKINTELDKLNKGVQELRRELKKETQPQLKMEINNKIRKKLIQIEELINKLE